jgi:hypothetical protein
MTIEELYKNFCENFKKISALTSDSGTSEWTKAIYHYFYKEGVENGFRVWAKPNILAEGEQEYIVDLCWSKELGSEYKDYMGLELALESEWLTSKDEIMWDFCKLIDIKSFLKVMVICVREEEVNTMLQEMVGTIKKSRIRIPDENYLIIIFIPLPTFSSPRQYVIEGYKANCEGVSNKLQTVDFIFN